MQFRVLGPLEGECEGRLLDLGRRKQRELLAVLLINANTVVSLDALVAKLWQEGGPPNAIPSVHVLVSRLRKALSCETAGEQDRIQTRRPGYLMRLGPGELDAHQVDQLVNEGYRATSGGRHEDAVECFSEALSLWRGPALAEFAGADFAHREIRRLEELRLVITEEHVEARLVLGHHHQLVGQLEALVAEHPLQERLWAARMLALYRAGRQVEALRAYRDLHRMLADELGIEPSPKLKRLEGEILFQSASLEFR